MIGFKLLILIICGCLFSWGGFNFKQARRFIMPALICLFCLFITKDPWCLMQLSAMGVLCMGYGDNSPLRHIFGQGWGRGIWSLLAAICLSLPLFLTHHLGTSGVYLPVDSHTGYAPLSILFFVLYLALNFTLENALKNLNQLIGDVIIGVGFGSIVFLVQ